MAPTGTHVRGLMFRLVVLYSALVWEFILGAIICQRLPRMHERNGILELAITGVDETETMTFVVLLEC